MEDRLQALIGGTLIDGTGRDPLGDSVVLIDGGVVKAAGARAQVKVPRGAEAVDVSGRTVMPGLFDCHCHFSLHTMSIEKRLFTPKTLEVFQTARVLKKILHAGFTTVREPGVLNDIGFKRAEEMGLIESPRLVLAGGIGQTGGHFDEYYPRGVEVPFFRVTMADGVPGVQKAARQVLRQGFDFVKICTTGGVASPADSPEYTEWTLDEIRAMVYEARARGKEVIAHAEGNQGIKNAILGGVWSVEHGSMLDEEAIDLFKKSGTYLVPTLFILENLTERGKEIGLTEVSLAKVGQIAGVHAASFQMAAKAGVKIACGTDAIDDVSHGQNARELEYMVRLGFTPMQAIVAATKTSSEACRVDHKVGTLEVGKLADLLVVDGDPLSDIRVLQDASRLLVVMKEGKRYVDGL